MRRAVILFSGGLDSTTVLAITQAEGFDVSPLTIAYGQRHWGEVEAARRCATVMRVKNHKIVEIDLATFGGSALTESIVVPKDRNEAEMTDIPVTYVPARNTVMLSLALRSEEHTSD